MMKAESAKKKIGDERFNFPMYDARAPRNRAKTMQTDPQRQGNWERSR
jgi:hypothetical protein